MKRHYALQPLSRQHHQGLLVVLLLKKGLAKQADISVMVQFLLGAWQQELLPHFAEEELQLMPVAKEFVEQHYLEKLVQDHHDIRQIVERIAAGKGTANLILDFASRLDAHIRWEERVLFPALEAVMPAERLEALKLQEEEQFNCMQFPVRFWE